MCVYVCMHAHMYSAYLLTWVVFTSLFIHAHKDKLYIYIFSPAGPCCRAPAA